MSSTTDKKEELRQYLGVRMLWPPDCPDDILQTIVREVLGQETIGLSFDKDGEKITENIKKFCDNNFEPYWHVFIGNSFGCYAVHEKRRFIYFYYKKNAFLIYKAQ